MKVLLILCIYIPGVLFEDCIFNSVELSILYCPDGVIRNLNCVLFGVQINKQNEQMHGLLAIALTMYPMRIDESIHTQLREKYGDKMIRMQKG